MEAKTREEGRGTIMVMIGNLWNFTALFELPRSAGPLSVPLPPPLCIARQAGGGLESQAKLVRANSFKGACTNDVCSRGGEGVSQFLTKEREVAWIW